ncbi:MAG: hypothetical protein E7439_06580 [Ruminococcaceae bacterium]|nr:hypothetical protein [Oscillospiraceae bacterium]
MPILSAAEEAVARTPLDNALTLGLVGLLALVVIIAVIRKAVINKKAAAVTVQTVAEDAAPAPVAPGSAGQLKLHNVEPKTAAMLMAIVADKLGKPLNELHFISIKEVN